MLSRGSGKTSLAVLACRRFKLIHLCVALRRKLPSRSFSIEVGVGAIEKSSVQVGPYRGIGIAEINRCWWRFRQSQIDQQFFKEREIGLNRILQLGTALGRM